MIPALIINTAGNERYYDDVAAQIGARGIFEPTRVEGVLGSLLPNGVCLRLTGDRNSVNNKGALGCLLAHVKAWEIVANHSHSFCVILEDDADCNNLSALSEI